MLDDISDDRATAATPGPTPKADRRLDITGQICPLTFVRTKLALETMAPGEVLEVRLRQGEPLDNVPRSVREMGHELVALEAETEAAGIYRLWIRLKG